MVHARLVLALFACLMTAHTWAQPGTEATYQRLDGIVAVVGDEIVLASDIRDRVTQAKLEGRIVTDDNECGLLESVLFEKLLLHNARLDSLEVTGDLEAVAASEKFVDLRLRGPGIRGELASLTRLLGTTLVTVSLVDTQVSGTVPQLAGAQQLRVLDVRSSRLNGAIPCLPQDVQVVSLINNYLSGPVPDCPYPLHNSTTLLVVAGNKLERTSVDGRN